MNEATAIPTGAPMGEWYLFAAFVFLLAALLLWFYKRTPRSQKKREEKSFEREAKLFKLYQNIEDLMDGFEEYVEELQSSFRLESGEIKRRVEALETQHAAIRHTLRDMSAHAAEPQEAYEGPLEAYEPEETYEQPISQEDGDEAQEIAEETDDSPLGEGWPAPGWPDEGLAEWPDGDAPQEQSITIETIEEPASSPESLKKRELAAPLNRAQRVRILQDEGLDAVRIARELGLSLNEVNLIIQLDVRPDASLV